MKRLRLLLVAFVACAWVHADLSHTVQSLNNLSKTTFASTGTLSVVKGDVVVMAVSSNKRGGVVPLTFSSTAGTFVEADARSQLGTDPNPNSYVSYLTIDSPGTFDFVVSHAVSITASVWLYKLTADSGNLAFLDSDAVEFNSDANISLPMSYGWDGTTYDNIVVIESGSALKGVLDNTVTGVSGSRITSLSETNGTTAASAWSFTYDPANLGKNSGSIAGVAFAEISSEPLPPIFITDPLIGTSAVTNQPYTGSIADQASDPNGDPMFFSVSPSNTWLSVAANGEISGTPQAGDLGTNHWTVSVTDGISGTNSATLKIFVTAPQTSRTNIVMIVVDDLGWMDLSIQGSEFYETPRIDELATSGMRFTQGYAAHPRCLPSRYGLMSGRFPGANGVPGGPESNLRPWDTTVAEALKAGGYATCFAGKWHLIGTHGADNLPQNQGFDVNFSGGKPGAPPTYFYPYRMPGVAAPTSELATDALYFEEEGVPGEYVTDRLTDEALDWMSSNADQPMFLCMWHYGVHTPYEAPAGLVAKYEAKLATMDYGDQPEYINVGVGQQKMRQDHPIYAAMIESVDTNIGRLMDKVAELGIAGNTVFIFTADNGGLSNRGGYNGRELATANLPLRTGKGWLYEGGMREAFIVSGAGVATMVNSNAVVNGTDIYPTCLELAGLPLQPSNHLDGVSFASALDGSTYDRGEPIFWHCPLARPYSTGDFDSSAIRDGDYKLIWWYTTPGKNYELYNVKLDKEEAFDLSESMPEKAAELLGKLQAWHAGDNTGSGVITKSDADDVSKPPQAWLDDPTAPATLLPMSGNLSLSWGDYLGFDYDLYSRTNLTAGTWMPEGTGITTNEAVLPMVGNEGFYKVDLVLQPES
ncbi:sulfatase-like hydrolase/transferase [Pontiella sulfatireligans]|uniref:Arylsulfatase n=1 Tax=Pontiella sulfatireligans TaxID=2750658 RepID=A0A6C2UHB1_9BACT|nr:sulfatase-like hydrolase/transferase [Pontiella sulfatireligans]SPS74305.1 sulfatase S1_16 [Kiritimatiellales bacterium]VGO19243.1 Arylsulfatase [Pontiella sulfatireligans]